MKILKSQLILEFITQNSKIRFLLTIIQIKDTLWEEYSVALTKINFDILYTFPVYIVYEFHLLLVKYRKYANLSLLTVFIPRSLLVLNFEFQIFKYFTSSRNILDF